MNSSTFYKDYVLRCVNSVKQASNDLHEALALRNSISDILYANLNCLEANGITKEMLDSAMTDNSIPITFKTTIEWGNKAVATVVRINWNKFVNLVNRRIPRLMYLINYYDWLSSIPATLFSSTVTNLNRTIGEYLLRGDTVTLGTYLGSFQILKARCNKMVLNCIKSFAKRKELMDKGIIPKSSIHPDGAEWMVRSHVDWYWFARWGRKNLDASTLPQIIFYRFKLASSKKSDDYIRGKGYNTIEDCIKAKDLQPRDKLNFIIHNDPNINDRYPLARGKKDYIKNGEINDYIRPEIY